jgi:hypothetical protein
MLTMRSNQTRRASSAVCLDGREEGVQGMGWSLYAETGAQTSMVCLEVKWVSLASSQREMARGRRRVLL